MAWNNIDIGSGLSVPSSFPLLQFSGQLSFILDFKNFAMFVRNNLGGFYFPTYDIQRQNSKDILTRNSNFDIFVDCGFRSGLGIQVKINKKSCDDSIYVLISGLTLMSSIGNLLLGRQGV